MGKDGNFYPKSYTGVIYECSSTAYSEPPTDTHNAVIQRVASELFNECGLGSSSKITEIGAGHGQFLDELVSLGIKPRNTIAVNILSEDSEVCMWKGFYVSTCDMHELMEYSDTFKKNTNLVIMRHILEHSPFPFFILRNLCGILKEGSYVYVEVPAPDSWANHESNPNHYSVMGANMWRSLFLKAGFKIKRDWNIEVPIPQPSGDVLTDTYFGFVLEA